MPRYTLVENTQMGLERYELTISDGGTFSFSYGTSDPAGDAGGGTAKGTWTRSGETYTFTTTEGDGPNTATLRGSELEVAGYGTFSAS